MHIFDTNEHIPFDLKAKKMINSYSKSNNLSINLNKIGLRPLRCYIPEPINQILIMSLNVCEYNIIDKSSMINKQYHRSIYIFHLKANS